MSDYRVVIYDRNIVSLIQVGEGQRWIHSKAKAIERTARAIAPKRTGRLAASHVTVPTRGTNQYQKLYRISAQSYYAQWVHDGTGPRIYPKRKRRLKVPNRGRPGFRLLPSVNGQPAKLWLARAGAMHS